MSRPTKEQVKATMEEVEAFDLGDGAHWALIHEKLGLTYGDVFRYIADDPEFFGYAKPATAQPSIISECPVCGRLCKGQNGLAMHTNAKHLGGGS